MNLTPKMQRLDRMKYDVVVPVEVLDALMITPSARPPHPIAHFLHGCGARRYHHYDFSFGQMTGNMTYHFSRQEAADLLRAWFVFLTASASN